MNTLLIEKFVVVVTLTLVLVGVVPATAQNIFPSTGNVGIGTQSPAAALHVKGNSLTGVAIDSPSGNVGQLLFMSNGQVLTAIFRPPGTGDLQIDSNITANLL